MHLAGRLAKRRQMRWGIQQAPVGAAGRLLLVIMVVVMMVVAMVLVMLLCLLLVWHRARHGGNGCCSNRQAVLR